MKRPTWWKSLKRTVNTLKKGEPGQRFVDVYEERQRAGRSRVARFLVVGLGLLVLVVGLVGLPAPGPGGLAVLLGLGLLGSESRRVAGALDTLEDWVRQRISDAKGAWTRESTSVRIVYASLGVLACGILAAGGFVVVRHFIEGA
jgi:uncharacterized protein (TIGR02611 family)